MDPRHGTLRKVGIENAATRRGDFRPPHGFRRRAPQGLHHCRRRKPGQGAHRVDVPPAGKRAGRRNSLRRGCSAGAWLSQPCPRCFDSFISPMRQGRPDSIPLPNSENLEATPEYPPCGQSPPRSDWRSALRRPHSLTTGTNTAPLRAVSATNIMKHLRHRPGGRGCQRRHPRCQRLGCEAPPSTSSASCGRRLTPVRQTFPYDLYDTVSASLERLPPTPKLRL